MTKLLRTNFSPLVLVLGLVASLVSSSSAQAFPENIRFGYTNCGSCHVNPTGGGVLTAYGRSTSEEIMATWSKTKEAEFLHGSVPVPSSLNVGGDVRFMSLYRDNKVTESKVGFPMQADVELAYRPFESLSLVASLGAYDGNAATRRHYLLYTPNENWYVKAGRFITAYGIYQPDHSIVTRKFLRLDQNMETLNAEVGYVSESFEWVAAAISGDGGEHISRDDGFSTRFAYYLGKDSQVGLSFLQGNGIIWDRQLSGVFGLFTIAKKGLLQTEWDLQNRKAAISDDPSLPDNAALVSFTRFSWELFRGFNLFGTIESLDSTKGDYTKRQRAYGPGFQWIPRPHFEFLAKYEAKLDEVYSKDYGSQAMLMSHYYF